MFGSKTIGRIISGILVFCLGLGFLAACDSEKPAKNFTYTQYITSNPATWNPQRWENSDENTITNYITDQLLTFSMADGGIGYTVTPSLAKALPTDVSVNYKAKSGVPASVKEGDGYAWRFELRPEAQWEDGTPINTESFVYSFQKLLDMKLDNKQADTFTNGPAEIYGAYGYRHGGSEIYSRAISDDLMAYTSEYLTSGASIYFGWNMPLPRILIKFFKDSRDFTVETWKDLYTLIPEAFTIETDDSDSLDVFTKWQTYVDQDESNGMLLQRIQNGTVWVVDIDVQRDLTNDLIGLMSKWLLAPEINDNSGYYYGYRAALDAYGGNYDLWATNIIESAFDTTDSEGNQIIPWIYEIFVGVTLGVEKVAWSTVGFKTINATSFDVIFASPITNIFDLTYYFASHPFLIHKTLFESTVTASQSSGGQSSTNYCTDAATSISYGPYSVKSFEKNKSMHLSKNTNWIGYKSGIYNNQYQTTDIIIKLGLTQTNALEKFLSGELSEVSLTAQNVAAYLESNFIYHSPETNTYKLSLNSDRATLATAQANAGGNVNKLMLANSKFRQAISLSLDRSEYSAKISTVSTVELGLINETYLSKSSSRTAYRNEALSKLSLLALYNETIGVAYRDIQSPWNPNNFMRNIDIVIPNETYTYGQRLDVLYEEITAYNTAKARELFKEAFEEAIASGDYNTTQVVIIDYVADHPSPSAEFLAHLDLLQKYIDQALEGTNYAGKVSISPKGLENPSVHAQGMRLGTVDSSVVFSGTDFSSPFSVIERLYLSGVQKQEYGLDTEIEITIVIDDEEKTYTLEEWGASLVGSWILSDYSEIIDYSQASYETKLLIASTLEYYILNQYCAIPIAYSYSSKLLSKQVSYGTSSYIPFLGYGGIRYLTYNFNDSDWAKQIKNPANLSY